MYIKVSDNIGMSTLRIFNYVEELPSAMNTNNVTVNNVDLSQFVTKDELQSLVKEFIDNEQLISTASTIKDDGTAATAVTKSQPKIVVKKQQ